MWIPGFVTKVRSQISSSRILDARPPPSRGMGTERVDPEESQRDHALDQMKGLLIFLVVIGHLVPGSVLLSAQEAWYGQLRATIYLFHMPAFFFVGGILFGRSAWRKWPSVPRRILSRANRLLVPYVGMGILILLGKYGAAQVMHVDNLTVGTSVGDTILTGVYALFIETSRSPSTSIWFLLAYFLCLLAAIPLSRTRHGEWWMLLFTALLFIAPRFPYLYLDKLGDDAIFFSLGWIYAIRNFRALEVSRQPPPWALALLLFLLLFPALQFDAARLAWRLIFGLGSSLLILWEMELWSSRVLAAVGRASMAIYVLNTPVIGLVRASFSALHLEHSAFVGSLLLSAIAAMALPLMLRHQLLMRGSFLERYLR